MRLSSETIIDAPADRALVADRVCETGLGMFPLVEETIVAYDEAATTFTYAATGVCDGAPSRRSSRW